MSWRGPILQPLACLVTSGHVSQKLLEIAISIYVL